MLLGLISVSVEERVCGETRWIAIRARGAEWSWLTPREAAEIGKAWVDKYSDSGNQRPAANQHLVSKAAARAAPKVA